MHKYFKISIGLLSAILLWSFQYSSDVKSFSKSLNHVLFADTLTWKQLGEIKFITKKHAEYGEIEYPLVNSKLKKLQGKEVVISGFIVPIDNKNYAISKNVFASCFFCGKAGPETIMGIKFKGAFPKIKTDTYMTLKGKFRYNEGDPDDWIYHIENAVSVK
jgi:hypothetical protein